MLALRARWEPLGGCVEGQGFMTKVVYGPSQMEIVSEEGTGRCRTAQWRGRIRPSGSRLDVTDTT